MRAKARIAALSYEAALYLQLFHMERDCERMVVIVPFSLER
jgi:hypothetical protein